MLFNINFNINNSLYNHPTLSFRANSDEKNKGVTNKIETKDNKESKVDDINPHMKFNNTKKRTVIDPHPKPFHLKEITDKIDQSYKDALAKINDTVYLSDYIKDKPIENKDKQNTNINKPVNSVKKSENNLKFNKNSLSDLKNKLQQHPSYWLIPTSILSLLSLGLIAFKLKSNFKAITKSNDIEKYINNVNTCIEKETLNKIPYKKIDIVTNGMDEEKKRKILESTVDLADKLSCGKKNLTPNIKVILNGSSVGQWEKFNGCVLNQNLNLLNKMDFKPVNRIQLNFNIGKSENIPYIINFKRIEPKVHSEYKFSWGNIWHKLWG